jgi:hypothetical protein
MPDTLTYSRAQEEPHAGPPEFIGTYCAHGVPLDDDSLPSEGGCEVRALLAHIDALTAAVEAVRVEGAAYAEEDNWWGGVEAMRKVAADILRGGAHDA